MPAVLAILLLACNGCAYDGPDTIEGAQAVFVPIEVDAREEARGHNGGPLLEFVADASGYVSTPSELPVGEVMITLTYTGDVPAPHSLIFEGLNGNQPVVAVDVPGSNHGTIVVPAGGLEFFDGAPGNRAAGFEGHLQVTGLDQPVPTSDPEASLSWTTNGLAFTSAPDEVAPPDVPIELRLTVSDALPHSIAFERVRGDEPLVAVDGPGTNQRTITLPRGTYVYFCAVPGHRGAGMEGLLHVG